MTVIDDFFTDRQAAREQATTQVDVNPDNAARAIQVGNIVGMPAQAVVKDLPTYEREAQAQLASQIIKDSPYLQTYINSNPMAASVSNDDWGTLDGITRKIAGFSAGLNKTLVHTAEAFIEGLEPESGLGSWLTNTPEKAEWWYKQPQWQRHLNTATYTTLGLPIELPARVFGGVTKAAGPFVEQTYGNITGDWNNAKRLGREAQGFMEYLFNRLPEFRAAGPVPRYLANRELRAIADEAGPYLRAGEPVPPGVNALIDQHKIEQSKIDGEQLADLTSDVQKSTTKARDPELFADALRPQMQGVNIYIPWSAIEKIYGENPVRPDDNKLGWVPDIQAQVSTMSMTRGDIVVPLADWLAKVDPQLAKDIHDNIRVRRGGFTIEEAQQYREMASIDVFHGSPHTFEAWGIDQATGQPKEVALTGEGATSFGHPLEGGYFAGARETATSYATGVRGAAVKDTTFQILDKDGKVVERGVWSEEHAKSMAAGIGGTYKLDTETTSNLYRVRIKADPEQLLDWDKPFDQQPPKVQEILNRMAADSPEIAKRIFTQPGFESLGPKTGRDIYGGIGRGIARGTDQDIGRRDRQASERLRSMGIPGIQYLDQGSRHMRTKADWQRDIEQLKADIARAKTVEGAEAIEREFGMDVTKWRSRREIELESAERAIKTAPEKSTYNYVIFDRDLIEILDRNGEAVQSVRRGAGLDLPQVAPAKKVTLERRALTPEEAQAYEEAYGPKTAEGITGFTMRNLAGEDVGLVHIRESGTALAVEFIRADEGAQSLGLASVRDIVNQLTAEYPNAKTLEGFRVSGAREKAGATGPMKLNLVKPSDQEIRAFAQSVAPEGWQFAEGAPEPKPLPGEEVRYYSKTTKAYVLPREKWHWVENVIADEVQKVFDRIAPQAKTEGVGTIVRKGGTVRGIFIAGPQSTPIILWALDSKDPFGTARHEAIHYLRDQGFFTKDEWETLRTAAIEENWIQKHNIDSRYHDATPELQIEEAIAEQYAQVWSKDPAKVKGAIAKVFEKLHILLVEIQEAIARAIGHKPTIDELFEKIESGEIGARTGTKPLDIETQRQRFAPEAREALQKEKQLELDVTRQADKAIFEKASALGMTVDQYNRYLKLIEKRNLEDIQAQRERAIAFEKKRQSQEWKDEANAIEDDVRSDLRNRPDVAAADFFRYGELYGQKVEGRKERINSDLLTEEQRKLLPEYWQSPDGMHPDDAAKLFGYADRNELIEKLAAFEQARGNVRPGEFFHRLVKAEVERRLVEKYGELNENILRSAEDHVLGVTQMDMLHEETLARAAQSGEEFSFTKEDMQNWAATKFNEQPSSKVSTIQYLNDAGRSGRAVEMALLKGDYLTAFKEKQAQYLSVLMAKEAKTFEKETARFEKLANTFSRREGPKAVDQKFTDQIQDLLRRADLPVRRTAQELFDAMERADFQTLDKFVQYQTLTNGYELEVQPYLSGQIKTAENMTVQEAREFRTAIHSLNHVGREDKKIQIGEIKVDYDAWKEEALQNIRSRPIRPEDKQNRWFYRWDAMQTKMEEIVKDLDLRKALGPMFDALIRPMMESKHTEYDMLEKLAKRFTELRGANKAWQKTLNDEITQNFFFDPNGTLFNINRQDMIGIMLNFGNKSNIEKFVKGWAGKEDPVVFERKLRTMIDQFATKEDWDFVQNIWNVFEMWKPEMNEMYYQLSGVPPKNIEAQGFTNAHGNYKGGYFPVIYSPHWAGDLGKSQISNTGTFANYHRSTPANHYTKERTGYINYVEFRTSIEQVAARMQQEIHDIAYRRQLIAANKIINDKEIMSAIRHHYGVEYEKQFKPWVQKIASHYQMDEQAVSGANEFLRRIRYNLIGHALPLNLKVLLSPSTGLANPLNIVNPVAYASWLWNRADNNALAMEKSKEIPHTFRNMDRDFRERLEATINAKGFDAARADVLRATFWPAVWVEQQFRINTFTTEYKKNLVKGMSEADAAVMADSVVRERHGSAGLPDLPAIMSSNEAMKAYTMFYGFFNTMYNWQRQIPGQVRRGEYGQVLKTLFGAVLIPSLFGIALFNQRKEDDSWWQTIGKGILLQPLSTAVFAREIGSGLIEGFPSRTGLGGIIQSMRTSAGDIVKAIQNKEVKKPIQHTANLIGLTTGLPMAQLGRTGQFTWDVNAGKQRPRDFPEWFRGIVTGEARLKK